MSIVSYNTVVQILPAGYPAWDGSCVGADGCSCSKNRSLGAYAGTDLAGETRTYETESTLTTREPEVNPRKTGKAWLDTLAAGGIAMSPFRHRTIETKNYLAGVPYATVLSGRLTERFGSHKVGGSCQYYCYNKQQQWVSDYCRVQGDLAYWREQGLQTVVQSEVSNADILNASLSVREDASAASFRSWDALTDLAEVRDTLNLIKDISSVLRNILFAKTRAVATLAEVIRALRYNPKHLLKQTDKGLRRVGDWWMQQRYGIMPLVYSYHDAAKTIQRGFRTFDRATRVVTPSTLSPSIPNGSYISKNVTGNVTVRAVVGCAYSSANLARYAGVGMNLFQTGWELIPLSFVWDWFFNVGNYIVTKTSADFSSLSRACMSQKVETIETYELHYSPNINLSATINSGAQSNGQYCWPAYTNYTNSLVLNSPQTELLTTVSTRLYDRTLFDRRGTTLRWTPSLNWRRYIDSMILTNQSIGKVLKLARGARR